MFIVLRFRETLIRFEDVRIDCYVELYWSDCSLISLFQLFYKLCQNWSLFLLIIFGQYWPNGKTIFLNSPKHIFIRAFDLLLNFNQLNLIINKLILYLDIPIVTILHINFRCFFILSLDFNKIYFYYLLLHRITAKIDNDMLKYYCNEDSFLLEVRHAEDNENMLDIILIEFMDH